MQVIARSGSERGELVLRERPDGTLELRVNGIVVMDSSQTSSERLLARATVEARSRDHRGSGPVVLIGGLGLGVTLAEVLADPRVRRVVVAEIEPELIIWHRSGVVPDPRTDDASRGKACGPSIVDDERVEVVAGDVREVVAAQPAQSLDTVLLDVDNGPDHLVYDVNAAVYSDTFLVACADVIRPGGILAIWCADTSVPLRRAMRRVFGAVDERVVPVTLGGRATTYRLLIGRRAEDAG